MNIVYCRQCSPPRVLAAGAVSTPARHIIDNDEQDFHTDCGVLKIPDELRLEDENGENYLARLQEKYAELLT